MTCDACAYAQENPLSFYHREGCTDCAVRALAGSPWYEERNKGDEGAARYLEALRKLGIAESAKAAHSIVEEAYNRIQAAKQGRRATTED